MNANYLLKFHVVLHYYSGTSIPDTLGTEESVLISGVELYTNLAFGTAKGVMFTKVSSFQGVLIRGFPLYTVLTGFVVAYTIQDCLNLVTPVSVALRASLDPF